MLDYSRDYYEVLKRDFKRVILAFSIINAIATIAYPIFALIVRLGNLYVNISILVLAIIYGVAELFTKDDYKGKLKRVYSWLRIILSTIALAINVYSIYIAATEVNGIAIIIATIMIIFWILKVLANIMYDLIVPRIHTMALCLYEDAKPYGRVINTISRHTNDKEIIDTNRATPDEVINVVHKALKISNKNREEKIKSSIDELDLDSSSLNKNNDGAISIEDIIATSLKIPGVIVDKKEFLNHEFNGILDKEKINLYYSRGPKRIGFNDTLIGEYVDSLLAKNKSATNEAKKYLLDNYLNVKNEHEFKKAFNSFSINIIGTMQKIIYLYGFEEIKENESPKPLQMAALIDAFSVVLEDESANECRRELMKLSNMQIGSKLKGTIFEGAERLITNERVLEGIFKLAPVALSFVAKGKYSPAIRMLQIAYDTMKTNK